jgi:hypothetical protein
MDLHIAEKLSGKAWNRVKIGAFLCFLVACLLLIASLFVPPPAPPRAQIGNSGGTSAAVPTHAR